MKKILITTSIVASILSTSVFADDGKVEFIGSITDDACTVVNEVSSPLQVTLGTVASTAFNGAGSTAAPTKFTIALTSCPTSVTSASVKFDGSADENVSSLLQLTQTADAAKNVAIQLADKTGANLPLFSESTQYALNEGTNNLDFTARYYATSDSITAGSANAISNFTIVYN